VTIDPVVISVESCTEGLIPNIEMQPPCAPGPDGILLSADVCEPPSEGKQLTSFMETKQSHYLKEVKNANLILY
jgi:hypothetical protein